MPDWIQRSTAVPADFNGPVDVPFHPFEDAWIEQPIFTRFVHAASAYGDHVALTDAQRQFSYSQVLRHATALARRIARFPDRTPVGIMLGQNAHFPIAALACLAAGRAYVPIDPKHPPARIATVLADAGSTLVIAATPPPADAVPPTVQVLRFATRIENRCDPGLRPDDKSGTGTRSDDADLDRRHGNRFDAGTQSDERFGTVASRIEADAGAMLDNDVNADSGLRPMCNRQPDTISISDTAPDYDPGPLDVSAPAVILYTSGSTGQPKGICNNQRALLQRVCEATNSSHINSSDQVLLLSSPGTIAGEREMFAALLNGATLTLCDPQNDGLHGVLRLFAERQITICYMVPALFRMLLRAPGAALALAHLRVLRIGGDITLSSDLLLFRRVAPPDCHFLASFSATEMPAVFQWFVPRDWRPDGPRVPVGYPRPEVDICTRNESGQNASPGEFAELVVRSRYLALGEWRNGQLQPDRFATDGSDPSMRILRSGDMVRARNDGLWELTGRKDRQIKINGQRIDVGEVEEVLRNHPAVDDVAVIARRAGEETVALVAFVASSTAQPSLLDDLRTLVAQRVPGYMRPAQIHRLDKIPQLPGFKADVGALHTMDQEFQQAIHENAPPSVPAQMHDTVNESVRKVVRLAWTRVLGANSYRLDLPFDQSGGDSLKALELWFHVEESLNFKLGLDAMRIGSRPSELERALRRELTRPANAASPAGINADAPLIYLSPGILGDDPMQLRFRAAFGDSVRFKLINYPNWRDTMASDCNFEAIIDAGFRQICADPPQQVYQLAGYSYGGIVAYELARRLVESGRQVGMVALLDSRRWDMAETRPVWQADHILPEVGWSSRLLAPLITLSVRARCWRLLTLACTLLTRHANRMAFRFRNRMTKDLRIEALRKWRAQPLSVPVTLFLSSDRWPGEPDGYGWQDLCEQLKIVHIGGTHATIIDRPGRELIAVHIQQALATRLPTPSERQRA